MIRKTFETRLQVDLYLTEQKIRMEKGYLTRSEREELKQLMTNPESLVVKKIEIPDYKKIITDINVLKIPCLEVRKDEDIKHIIKDLKETFAQTGGLGISANQIGYNRKVFYIKVLKKFDQQTKTIEFSEYIMINPKIIELSNPIKVQREGCLSFPGIFVDTKRFIYCTVQFEDENRKPQVATVQDLESFAIQHETDHLNGVTIFDNKWRA